MKTLVKIFVFITVLLAGNLQAATEHVLLKVDGSTATQSHTVTAGKVAEIVYIYMGNDAFSEAPGDFAMVTIGGTSFNFDVMSARFFTASETMGASVRTLPIPGPATITLNYRESKNNFMVIKVNPNPNIMGIKQ